MQTRAARCDSLRPGVRLGHTGYKDWLPWNWRRQPRAAALSPANARHASRAPASTPQAARRVTAPKTGAPPSAARGPAAVTAAAVQPAVDAQRAPGAQANVTVYRRDGLADCAWRDMCDEVVLHCFDGCQDAVNREYVIHIGHNVADCAIVGTVTRDGVQKKAGFLFANEVVDTGVLKVQLVCASHPGLGAALLAQAETFALQQGCSGVLLYALSHVVGYYRKLGYRHSSHCEPEDPEIARLFDKFARPLIEKHKADVRTYITPSGRYWRFLNALVRARLVHDAGCDTVKACNGNGYLMSKCLKSTPGPAPGANLLPGGAPAISTSIFRTDGELQGPRLQDGLLAIPAQPTRSNRGSDSRGKSREHLRRTVTRRGSGEKPEANWAARVAPKPAPKPVPRANPGTGHSGTKPRAKPGAKPSTKLRGRPSALPAVRLNARPRPSAKPRAKPAHR
jgi:hypothetical protein